MVRKGKSRLPIEKLMSISSPVMHGNKNTWGQMEDEVKQKLYKNLDKQIAKMLGAL